MLSCQRTEHRAVDRGPGYGGSVKIGDYGNKRWHKSTKIWQMERQKVRSIVILYIQSFSDILPDNK